MKFRFIIFMILSIIFIFIWISYLFTIQILDPHNFKNTIELRRNPSKQIIVSERGSIFDRNQELLVGSTRLYQIDLDRNAIIKYCKRNKNKQTSDVYQKTSKIIAEHTTLSQNSILQKLNKNSTSGSIYISGDISETQLTKIKSDLKKEKIPGLVENFCEIKRTYPKNQLAARLLGMIQKKEEKDNQNSIFDLEGICGLEATFDDELSGKFGWQEIINDANNKRIPLLYLKKREVENGNSLILTLDSDFQEILEENLKTGLDKYKAKNAIGIIMVPKTGEIIAMTGIAEDDSDKDDSHLRALSNFPVSFMFEPGSTLKPITALLAIENNIYTSNDEIDCREYHIEGEDRIIKDSHEHESLSFKDIIAYSSNVGISKIVEQIGSEALYDRMIELGFGRKTGSNLAGESSGIFRKLKDWQGYSLHSISFGQEISVTALQLANAYCALANDGKIMQPYIIKEIRDENDEIVKTFRPKLLRTVSNKKSLDTLKIFLKSVVDYGSATATKLDYLTIAGKTGTGEKILYGEKSYSEEKYTSVFAGFFPVENPKYVIVVIFDEPEYENYSYYASISAVPTFRNIVQNIINLPQCDLIIELKEKDKEFVQMPNLIGLTKEKAVEILRKKNLFYNLIENDKNGFVKNQYPKPKVSFDKTEVVIVILDKEKQENQNIKLEFKMPNLIGLTLREALAEANRKKIKLVINGKGIISSQSISEGSKIRFGEKCIITAN
ncbi:MAG: PASTA domain-containing protein [Armatimonadetes bacterium]|nr:PASTA domain-containing protein [Armatimonadota bacterium]